jgi:hypothetical protein
VAEKPLYTTVASVKVRLENKVQFQSEAEAAAEGELSNALLCQIIADAETDVEAKLRARYAIPFRSKTKGTFDALPDHTKRAIRKLVDYRAVQLVLSTDFGRGTHVDSDPYYKNLKDQLEEGVDEALGRESMGKAANRHKYSPPLEDLMLAASNAKADDGFRGMVINTDRGGPNNAVDYAEGVLNNPALSVVNPRFGRG